MTRCLVCIAERAREVPAVAICRVCGYAGCREHASGPGCARCYTDWDADSHLVGHLRALVDGYAAMPTHKSAAEPPELRELLGAAIANPLISMQQIRVLRRIGRKRGVAERARGRLRAGTG